MRDPIRRLTLWARAHVRRRCVRPVPVPPPPAAYRVVLGAHGINLIGRTAPEAAR